MTPPAQVLAGAPQSSSAERTTSAPARARHAAIFAARTVAEVWRTLRTARPGDRFGLASAVLRIRAKQFLSKLSPRRRFHGERLFGWSFDCFNYYDMLTTFEIIFLSREYRFTPRTARPRILDCGSNIGLSLLFFKREFPESTIIAFEPGPEAFTLLSRNVARNALHGIELHNLALAGAAGTRDLYCDSNRPGSTATSLLPGVGLAQCASARCALLSEFIREDIDLLKLDIEGAELEVIEDLARTGKIRRVEQMVIEYHPALFPHRDGYTWLRETLTRNGFDVQIRSGSLDHAGTLRPPVTIFAQRRTAHGGSQTRS